jgi:hypothetical protein
MASTSLGILTKSWDMINEIGVCAALKVLPRREKSPGELPWTFVLIGDLPEESMRVALLRAQFLSAPAG